MAKIRQKGLIAKKVGMTRVVDTDGNVIPVTLLHVPEQQVTKVMSVEREGYTGYQIGFQEKAEKHLSRADLKRLEKAGVKTLFSRNVEFRASEVALQVGESLTVEQLKDVSIVDITGLTKGRGFQGAIKRWNSSRGPMTHGSHYHRRTGSLGQNSSPSRVFKNKKMPGHLGVEQVTVRNLEVVRVDLEQNLIAIKGSVPGHNNCYIEVRSVV
jgi:large subunit ribosomal protein L3